MGNIASPQLSDYPNLIIGGWVVVKTTKVQNFTFFTPSSAELSMDRLDLARTRKFKPKPGPNPKVI